MSKLRKEIEFLERGMHRGRTKLRRWQQGPLLTLSMSMIGFKTKTTWKYHDYHDIEQGRDQVRYEMTSALIHILQ